MSRLIIVSDTFSGSRETVDLYCGESLASNLRRLWPGGIPGVWRLYRDSAHADNEIAALDLPGVLVRLDQTYVLVRGVAGDFGISFIINLAISVALSALSKHMARRRSHYEQQGESESPNNALAGQSNTMRAGGRVPEIYGRVRAYPDLLCSPIETWQARTQNIEQFFVLGMGNYQINEARLGETLLAGLANAGIAVYLPGAIDGSIAPRAVPMIKAVKQSPEVQSISLMTEAGAVTPVGATTFSASAQTMSVQARMPVVTGDAIDVGLTLDNDGLYVITSHPADTVVAPPYIYGLDRPLINETGASPLLKFFTFYFNIPATSGSTSNSWETYRNTLAHYKSPFGFTRPFEPVDGWLTQFMTAPIDARGYVSNYSQVGFVAGPGGNWPMWELQIRDRAGLTLNFGTIANTVTDVKMWRPLGSDSGGSSGSGPIQPAPSQWYRAPLDDIGTDGELWVDVAFPQGLVKYISGVRQPVTLDVRIEIRRPEVTDAQVTYTEPFTDSTTGPLRWTKKYTADQLATDGLPAGTGMMVRLTRMTIITQDDATHQYISETRWERLSAVRSLQSKYYPDCTVLKLGMTNSSGATSLGESAFNCIVTRMLPTWTGSAWSAYLPSVKWADAFVARCKATDGANKSDAQIDVAGIYALQAQLDTHPTDGDLQGRIAQTLDTVQDIDAELAGLADLVRAVVYRVGKKIFVTRDQATATRIALFNGRTKNPDGEGVAMRLTNDGENDCVTVMWLDVANGYKRREYTYPEQPASLQLNPLRAAPFLANWTQAWRRAAFEWNRIRFRREQINVSVTEDGRICRPGDVVNITDDIANIAANAGEVLFVSGLVLTLDRDVAFTAGHAHSVLLRDVLGQATDTIPVTAVAGSPNRVQLSRAPVGITIKPRDESMGTLYAFYDDSAAIVRQWLLTSVSANGPYVQLQGTNYNPAVYTNDTGTVDPTPPLLRDLPTTEETP